MCPAVLSRPRRRHHYSCAHTGTATAQVRRRSEASVNADDHRLAHTYLMSRDNACQQTGVGVELPTSDCHVIETGTNGVRS